MKRLTMYYRDGEEPYLSCERCGKTGISECWTQENCTQTAVDRLALIEDILGDEYDLGRLRKAVEKQSEYEQFMERWKQVAEIAGVVKQFGAERVADLVESDRNGRCVIVTRCCECKNHSDVDGEHYCKFWRMYCPNDSEFYCKAAKPLKGKSNGTT